MVQVWSKKKNVFETDIVTCDLNVMQCDISWAKSSVPFTKGNRTLLSMSF